MPYNEYTYHMIKALEEKKRWYSGKAQTPGSKLQPFPEHASSGTETREAETMAKGPETKEGLLHSRII